MAYWITKSGTNSVKPITGSKINWGHKITKDLVGCFICSEKDGHPKELVRGVTPSSTFTWGLGRYGNRCRSNGTWETTLPFSFHSGPWTICIKAYHSKAPGAGEYNSFSSRSKYTDATNNQGWALSTRASDDAVVGARGKFAVVLYNNDNFYWYSGVSCSAGDRLFVATSNGSSSIKLFINDVQSSLTASQAGDHFNGAYNASGGFGFGNTSSGVLSYIYLWYAWKRMLTNQEAHLLYSDPYCFIMPSTSKFFYGASAYNSLRTRMVI
jgi:hypothetical protein